MSTGLVEKSKGWSYHFWWDRTCSRFFWSCSGAVPVVVVVVDVVEVVEVVEVMLVAQSLLLSLG